MLMFHHCSGKRTPYQVTDWQAITLRLSGNIPFSPRTAITKPHPFHKPCTRVSSVNISLRFRGNVQDASHDPTGRSADAWISAASLWEDSRSSHRCT